MTIAPIPLDELVPGPRPYGLDDDSLVGLYLCRQPKDRADAEIIAARLGWEAERVANLLGVRLSE